MRDQGLIGIVGAALLDVGLTCNGVQVGRKHRRAPTHAEARQHAARGLDLGRHRCGVTRERHDRQAQANAIAVRSAARPVVGQLAVDQRPLATKRGPVLLAPQGEVCGVAESAAGHDVGVDRGRLRDWIWRIVREAAVGAGLRRERHTGRPNAHGLVDAAATTRTTTATGRGRAYIVCRDVVDLDVAADVGPVQAITERDIDRLGVFLRHLLGDAVGEQLHLHRLAGDVLRAVVGVGHLVEQDHVAGVVLARERVAAAATEVQRHGLEVVGIHAHQLAIERAHGAHPHRRHVPATVVADAESKARQDLSRQGAARAELALVDLVILAAVRRDHHREVAHAAGVAGRGQHVARIRRQRREVGRRHVGDDIDVRSFESDLVDQIGGIGWGPRVSAQLDAAEHR